MARGVELVPGTCSLVSPASVVMPNSGTGGPGCCSSPSPPSGGMEGRPGLVAHAAERRGRGGDVFLARLQTVRR